MLCNPICVVYIYIYIYSTRGSDQLFCHTFSVRLSNINIHVTSLHSEVSCNGDVMSGGNVNSRDRALLVKQEYIIDALRNKISLFYFDNLYYPFQTSVITPLKYGCKATGVRMNTKDAFIKILLLKI